MESLAYHITFLFKKEWEFYVASQWLLLSEELNGWVAQGAALPGNCIRGSNPIDGEVSLFWQK